MGLDIAGSVGKIILPDGNRRLPMTEADIRRALIEVLTNIQVQSGRPVQELTDDVRPLLDLEGFDSLNAEEVLMALTTILGYPFRRNPLFADRGRRKLTVAEIVSAIAREMNLATNVT
jgi:hypothetical protein